MHLGGLMQQNNKNVLLAIILSLTILAVWHFFYQLPRERQLQQYHKEQQAIQEKLNEAIIANPDLAPKERTEVLTREDAIRIPVISPSLNGSISTRGVRFDDLTLVKYHQKLDPTSPQVSLLSPAGTKNVYFSEFGWLTQDASIAIPTRDTVWQTNDKALTPDTPVTFFWDNGQGVRFTMHIALDENYMFNVTQKVANTSTAPLSLIPYGKLQRSYNPDDQKMMIVHEGLIGVMDDTLIENSYSDMVDSPKITYNSNNSWFGITDRYWQTAIIPDRNYSATVNFQYYLLAGEHRYQTDYRLAAVTIPSNDVVSLNHRFFAGAKEVEVIEEYHAAYHIPLFDRSVDFGALYFLTNPIFHGLKHLYNLFGNFGLAILGLTIIIKLLLFPLASKQYKAFAKMRKLAPQITELKERYKEDRMQMNREVMELYKQEKVNPMSGCLPVLIQLPVFFSLYKVLNITIEMRHAPFYGWIQDLSAPDPTSVFNLFGLIDWQPFGFLMIGAWPVLMCITMYIQYALNPKANDPMQEKVMRYLPLIFMFILARFPAGLIIYWTWSNVLSITQQYYITRSILKQDS